MAVYILKNHLGQLKGTFDSLMDARLSVHPLDGGYLYTEDERGGEDRYDLVLFAKDYTERRTTGNERVDECGWERPDGSRLYMFSRHSHFEMGRIWPPSGFVMGSGQFVLDYVTGENMYLPGNDEVASWPSRWPPVPTGTNVLPFDDGGPF